jgi:hypothetical protein
MANEVKLIIQADGSVAISELRKVSDATKDLENQTGFSLSNIRKSWLGYTAAIYAAYKSAEQALNMAEYAAREREMHEILDRLAENYNTTADAIIISIKKASGGLISISDAMQTSLEAISKGLSPKQIEELANVSTTLADITGQTTAEAFNQLANAIALGRERAIETRVGLIDLSDAVDDMGKKLTEAEKMTLRYELAMQKLHDIQNKIGNSSQSVADRLEQLKVEAKDLYSAASEIVLKLTLGVLSFLKIVAAVFEEIKLAFYEYATAVGWVTDTLGITNNAMDYWKKKVDESNKSVKGFVNSAIEDWKAIINSTHKSAESFEKHTESVKKATIANKELVNAMKEIQKELMSEEEKIIDTYEQYKKLGVDRVLLEQWFSHQTSKLAQKDFEEWEQQHLKLLQNEQKEKEEQAKKLTEAQTWLSDKIMKTSQNEYDYKRALLLKEYQERAEVLGWTEELYKAFTIELQEIDKAETEASIKELRNRVNQINQIYDQLRQDIINSYESAWANLMDRANAVGGEMGKAIGEAMANLKGITDIQAGLDPYTQEYNRIAEHYAQLIQLKIDMYGEEANIDAEWQAIMEAQETAYYQRRLAIASYTFGAMASAMYAFYEASGRRSRSAFEVYKAMAIAQTIIDTYQSAQAAYKAMAGIPVIGPTLAAIAASIAIAAGMARVAAIKMQRFGGSSSVVPTGGGGYNYTNPTIPTWQQETKEEKKPTQVVNIHIYGHVVDHDSFAREIVPAIQKAQTDGVR